MRRLTGVFHGVVLPRPLKLTPERTEALCAALRAGLPYVTACAVAGISYDTFRSWLRRAERGERRFLVFFEAVKRAESEAEQRLLARIEQAAEQQWQAAAWILERRWPDRWGARQRHEVASPGQDVVVVRITPNLTPPPSVLDEEAS